ncbi:MAG TPA: LysE family transporter [Methanomassiliicoccales archaeon]|nr:LysE family transporter [Methanomassiliicoccales archaeon]
MAAAGDPLLFLATIAFVSLSGVMAPGPIFATTIARGYQDGKAGLKIAVGHAVVEVPLMAGIFYGLDTLLKNDSVFFAIGLVGGAILLYMGYDVIRTRERQVAAGTKDGRNSFVAGIVMTAANPYFILWWATVGAALIAGAVAFGPIMLPLFAGVHLACDFAWYEGVSFAVFRSKRAFGTKWHKWLFVASGVIMLFFGLYFLASSIGSVL